MPDDDVPVVDDGEDMNHYVCPEEGCPEHRVAMDPPRCPTHPYHRMVPAPVVPAGAEATIVLPAQARVSAEDVSATR